MPKVINESFKIVDGKVQQIITVELDSEDILSMKRNLENQKVSIENQQEKLPMQLANVSAKLTKIAAYLK